MASTKWPESEQRAVGDSRVFGAPCILAYEKVQTLEANSWFPDGHRRVVSKVARWQFFSDFYAGIILQLWNLRSLTSHKSAPSDLCHRVVLNEYCLRYSLQSAAMRGLGDTGGQSRVIGHFAISGSMMTHVKWDVVGKLRTWAFICSKNHPSMSIREPVIGFQSCNFFIC